MAKRPDAAVVVQRKRELIGNAIRGKSSASSTALSASFGLPVEDVKRILKAARISDDD